LETTTTGTVPAATRTGQPSWRGIAGSMTTRSKPPAASSSRARSPSAARTQSWPAPTRAARAARSASGWSSTTRIRGIRDAAGGVGRARTGALPADDGHPVAVHDPAHLPSVVAGGGQRRPRPGHLAVGHYGQHPEPEAEDPDPLLGGHPAGLGHHGEDA